MMETRFTKFFTSEMSEKTCAMSVKMDKYSAYFQIQRGNSECRASVGRNRDV